MGFKKGGRRVTIVGFDDDLYMEATALLSEAFRLPNLNGELKVGRYLRMAAASDYGRIVQHIQDVGRRTGTRPEVVTGVCNIIRYTRGLSWHVDTSTGFNVGRFYERYSLVMANEHTEAAAIAEMLGHDAPAWWTVK